MYLARHTPPLHVKYLVIYGNPGRVKGRGQWEGRTHGKERSMGRIKKGEREREGSTGEGKGRKK